jgi:hypothetical protein
MAVDLAKLVVKLEAQTAQYQQSLDQANAKLSSFERQTKSALKGIGAAFSVLAIAGFAKSVIDAADRMNDLSKQTGVSVEGLSRLQYAAEQSGTDLEGLTTGLRKLSKTAADAADGGKDAAEAFARIGVRVKTSTGALKSTDELLVDVADSLSQYEDGVGKAAIVTALFGKTGAELIPFLNEGRAGIDKLRQEADRLGITMSTKAAQAADAFNDSLNRAKASATGLIREALTPLLAAFNSSSDAADATSAAMGALQGATYVLSAALKILGTAGVFISQVFQSAGGAAAALWAAQIQFLKGNFSEAASIIHDRQKDYENELAAANARYAKIWGMGTDAIATATEDADKRVKKTLIFGGNADALAETVVTASKIQIDAMDKFYAELDQLTQTNTEREIEQFDKIEAALNELRASGRLTAEEFDKRYSEALDNVLSEVTITAKKIGPEIMKEFDKLNEFEIEAARNTQDVIAETLKSGFEGGISGVIKRFGQMLEDLAAQAIAADIGGKLFGKAAGGSAGGSGWLGKLAQAGLSFFGGGGGGGGGDGLSEVVVTAAKIGSMDSGGRGRRGEPVFIGTGAQPELFVPDRPGTFTPAGAGAGGVVVHNAFNIQAPMGSVSRQTEMQIAAAAARGVAQGNRRNG